VDPTVELIKNSNDLPHFVNEDGEKKRALLKCNWWTFPSRPKIWQENATLTIAICRNYLNITKITFVD
jgi:hypothetical protein